MSDQPTGLALGLAPDRGEISRLIEAFEGLGEQLWLAPDTLYQMVLVLDELVTKVISYGGIDPTDGPIRVEFKAANGVLETVISDPGKPFDPRSDEAGRNRVRLRTRRAGAVP